MKTDDSFDLEEGGYLVDDDLDYRKRDNHLNIEENLNISKSFEQTESDEASKEDNDMLKLQNNIQVISNTEELKTVLKYKFKEEIKYSLVLIDKMITMDDNKENIQIIQIEDFIVILKYLNSEMQSDLVEMNDNFIEERRRYFHKDETLYLNIIQYFLKKKEEYFLCILSNIMSNLTLSQNTFDHSFYFYFNLCNQESYDIIRLKESYELVYNTGVK